MRRGVAAILLLYPRRVRVGHGPEIERLVEDLIARDGASRPAVMTRLAADGLCQRLASRSTTWAVIVTLAGTSLGSLAVSDLATASPGRGHRAPLHHVARPRHPHHLHRAGIIAR